MKQLVTLVCAALVLCAAAGAQAIEFKGRGEWIMSFDYGAGSQFVAKDRATQKGIPGYGYGGTYQSPDNFNAAQRLRLWLDAVASENLSATLGLEIGDQVWGRAGGFPGGAALGADGTVVEVKHAYLDWRVPSTDLKVRMGIQWMSLPALTTLGSQVFGDDVAGISLSNRFNENVALTAFWMRPFNDNYAGKPANYMDNGDFFSLLLPMTFDGVKVTPWAMLGFMGPNTFRNDKSWNNNNYFSNFTNYPNGMFNSGSVLYGLSPAVIATRPDKNYHGGDYTTPFWLGITGEVTLWDPFRLAWDVNYGNNSANYEVLRRSGWYGALLAEYKLDWGTPGLYFWYSSGDDGNIKNGSERMPTLHVIPGNGFSHYAGNGNAYIAREGVLGMDMLGTWGIGARLRDFSFIENLTHTLRVNYFRGSNDPAMAKYITGKKPVADRNMSWLMTDFYNPEFNAGPRYLTTRDSAMEFGLTSKYKIYENLNIHMDAAYIALWLDQSKAVWGGAEAGRYGNPRAVNGISTKDAWNVNVSFVYDF